MGNIGWMGIKTKKKTHTKHKIEEQQHTQITTHKKQTHTHAHAITKRKRIILRNKLNYIIKHTQKRTQTRT